MISKQLKFVLATLLLGLKSVSASDYCETLHAEFTRRQLDEHELETPYTQASGAKHTPFLTTEDGMATVTVGDGNPFHPMSGFTPGSSMIHFITHVYVMDQDGNTVFINALDPTVDTVATKTFEIPEGASTLTAYSWCNLHGLWEGPTIEVNGGTGSGICTVAQVEGTAWPSYNADFVHIQSMPPFLATTPYTIEDGTKHTPFITISEDLTSASVVVGNEEAFHPMNGGDAPHWITSVYITNQNKEIISMQMLDPTDVTKAEMTFDIPEGTESVTAWAFCNLHGLWVGPNVMVTANEPVADESKPNGEVADTNGDKVNPDDAASSGFTSSPASVLVAALVGIVTYLW